MGNPMKENDLSQTLDDLLDEFDRLEVESTIVSDRVGERETPREKSKKAEQEPTEIDLLYSDPQVIDFWKNEGQRYSYLYWVRAMIRRQIEPARIDPCLLPVADDPAELDRQRQSVYVLMAELLENPTKELAARITDGSLVEGLRALPLALSGHAMIEKGLSELAVLQKMKTDDLLNEIRMEYARIIYDSFFPYVAPYESIYLGDRQVQGEITGQVYRAYNAANLQASGEFADHIMHECTFVAELIGRTLNADDAEVCEKAQQQLDSFLADHLLPWATRFGHDFERVGSMLDKNSRDRPAQGYVTGIGKLVIGFFTLEANRFHAKQPLPDQMVRFALADPDDDTT